MNGSCVVEGSLGGDHVLGGAYLEHGRGSCDDMVLTLTENHSRWRYGDWSSLFLYSCRTSNRGRFTSTHPRNLWPAICSAYSIYRCKDRAEIEGMTNQWLALIETHPMGERHLQILLMVLCYFWREEPCITVFWKATSESERNRYGDPQLIIRWSSGSLWKSRERT